MGAVKESQEWGGGEPPRYPLGMRRPGSVVVLAAGVCDGHPVGNGGIGVVVQTEHRPQRQFRITVGKSTPMVSSYLAVRTACELVDGWGEQVDIVIPDSHVAAVLRGAAEPTECHELALEVRARVEALPDARVVLGEAPRSLELAQQVAGGVNWQHLHWLVLDTETTGFSPDKGDRIVEVGAVEMVAGEVIAKRGVLVNPGRPIPRKASQVHGIYDEHVRDRPPISRVADAIIGRARTAGVIVGFNIAFDLRFLGSELGPYGWGGAIYGKPVLDPFQHVRKVRKTGERSLVAACKHWGIEVPTAHAASADADITGKLLWAMRSELDEWLLKEKKGVRIR